MLQLLGVDNAHNIALIFFIIQWVPSETTQPIHLFILFIYKNSSWTAQIARVQIIDDKAEGVKRAGTYSYYIPYSMIKANENN